MKHKINPLIDCVFKTILGSEKNKNLLIHFLNAVLELKKGKQINDVTILNPYNEREFTSDKLSVVDVKVKDEKSYMYQIEVQLALHADIKARMLYTWSTVYRSQMEKGEDYDRLKPAVSIWILDNNLFKDVDSCHLPFSVYNPENKITLTDHFAIHLIQLPKWKYEGKIKSEKDRWIYLFKEGKNTDIESPPEILNTKEMRQVMHVLKDFSENQRNYLLYQSRREAVMKENTIRRSYEKKVEELNRMEKEKERIVKEKERIAKEKERIAKEKEIVVKEKEIVVKEKEIVVKEKEIAVKEKEKVMKKAEKEKKQLEARIKSMQRLLKEKGFELSDET